MSQLRSNRLSSSRLARRIAACLLLLALSSSLILPNLGYPRGIIFDETYYITHAQKYLNGTFFLESHPPLGKLLIALGEHWLHPDAPADEYINVDKIETGWPQDVDITGYRLMPALFGIFVPVLVFLIVALMTEKELVALALAIFVSLDNAQIVQARAALLDTFLIFFCLAVLLLFVVLMRKPRVRLAAFMLLSGLWGVVQACAADVKLIGAAFLVLAAIFALRLLRTKRYERMVLFCATFGLLLAITYLGIWQVHFSIARKVNPANDYGITPTHWNILVGLERPDPLTRFAIQYSDGIKYSLKTSLELPPIDLSNPKEIGSPWYWWLVGGRAMSYRWETPDGVSFHYVYLLGNPATWLFSLLGVLAGTVGVVMDLRFRFFQSRQRRWLFVLVLLYWTYMIPMIVTTRATYLHHYLLPVILGVMLFGLVLDQTSVISHSLKRNTLMVGLVLALFLFLIYSPLTYSGALTREQFQQRNVFPAWDLKCVEC